MLKLLRKQKFAKRIFYLLAIIIVPSFILWGSATVIRDKQAKGSKGYAGIIFGKKVSFDEFMLAMHGWRNELRMKFGDQTSQVESLFNPNEAVWYKLILLHEAKRLKLNASNEELTKYITSLPFLSRNGVFSPELYELFLTYSLNTPVRIFEEQMRDALKIQKLFEYVTADVTVSEDEIKAKYKQDNEQIKVKYISLLFSDISKEITLSEQELKDYYTEHKSEFRIPIQANLNYAGIDYPAEATDQQKEEINAKVKQAYEATLENKKLPAADEANGLKVNETGLFALGDPMADFGLSTNEIIPLFNLKEDQISEVVKTAKGPYFFQLKSKIVDFSPKFEEVKEKVKERLTYEKAKELAKTRMDDYLVKIKEKKETSPDLGLAEIAQSLDLSTAETDFFDSHSQPQEIGNSPEFNEVIFGLGEGEISKVIEFDRGYCIAQVSERKPIDEEAFVKEKDEVQKVALREKKDKIFEDYFNKLKEQSGLIDYVSTQQPTGQEQPADKSNPNVKPVDKSDLDVTQVDEF